MSWYTFLLFYGFYWMFLICDFTVFIKFGKLLFIIYSHIFSFILFSHLLQGLQLHVYWAVWSRHSAHWPFLNQDFRFLFWYKQVLFSVIFDRSYPQPYHVFVIPALLYSILLSCSEAVNSGTIFSCISKCVLARRQKLLYSRSIKYMHSFFN